MSKLENQTVTKVFPILCHEVSPFVSNSEYGVWFNVLISAFASQFDCTAEIDIELGERILGPGIEKWVSISGFLDEVSCIG